MYKSDFILNQNYTKTYTYRNKMLPLSIISSRRHLRYWYWLTSTSPSSESLLPSLRTLRLCLNTNNDTFRFASVYLRSSLSLPDFSSSVSTILTTVASPHSLICVDSNAKSPEWNSTSTKQRGSELERLLVGFKKSVANQPLNSLDFVPGGTAFVDITLTGDRVNLSRWLSLSTPPLSDSNFYSQSSPRITTSSSISPANRQRTF